MTFCKYCGKEIPEGATCSCAEAQAEANNNQQALNNDDAPVNPMPTSDMYTDENTADPKQAARTNLILAGGAAVILLVLILIISLIAGGGYKKPINNFVKGINKADSERIVKSMFTEDMLEDSDVDFDDIYDEMDDALDDSLDELEDEFGDDIKVKFSIDKKKEIKDKKLKDYEDFYDDYFDANVDIKKGYKITGTLSIEGDEDDDETDDVEIIVLKIKGEGWKLYPFDGGFANMIDF